jgi:hypothetical protein
MTEIITNIYVGVIVTVISIATFLFILGMARLFTWALENKIYWLVILLTITPFFLFVSFLTYCIGGLLLV